MASQSDQYQVAERDAQAQCVKGSCLLLDPAEQNGWDGLKAREAWIHRDFEIIVWLNEKMRGDNFQNKIKHNGSLKSQTISSKTLKIEETLQKPKRLEKYFSRI